MKSNLLTLLLATSLAATVQAQTLRWSTQGDLQTLDPHSQNESLTNSLNGQVYDYLVGRDKQLNVVAALATEWTQVTPTLWRVKLRPNVKFHDGTPFTAQAVKFTFDRISTDKLGAAAHAVFDAVVQAGLGGEDDAALYRWLAGLHNPGAPSS